VAVTEGGHTISFLGILGHPATVDQLPIAGSAGNSWLRSFPALSPDASTLTVGLVLLDQPLKNV
jgi:hypothetical protein